MTERDTDDLGVTSDSVMSGRLCVCVCWNCVTGDVVQQLISGGKIYYYY